MKILITGATGFVGKNLVARLRESYPEYQLMCCSSETPWETVKEYATDCDFIYYLAAVHRPKSEIEFDQVNYTQFSALLDYLEEIKNNCPVLYTSSIQAENGTAYGNSKMNAEKCLKNHAEKTGSRAIVYRLTNTFGRWGRPNGHSVVATFCYNIQRNIPIMVSDKNHIMHFYYIDDVIDSFLERLHDENPCADDGSIYTLPDTLTYTISLGELADLLYKFKDHEHMEEPLYKNDFERKMLVTFESYALEDKKQ